MPDFQIDSAATSPAREESAAPGAPATPAPPTGVSPALAGQKSGQSQGESPHVESQTPENRNNRINPSPEAVNASPASDSEK